MTDPPDQGRRRRSASATIGPGWGLVLADANRRLGALRPPLGATCAVDQGGAPVLTLTARPTSPEARAICDDARRLLLRTCSHCGSPGTARDGAVLRVTCDACEPAQTPARAPGHPYWPL